MTKKMKTEYKVRMVRRDHRWQVSHMHNYENFSHTHVVYEGSDWNLCMWIATGDPFYFPSKPYVHLCQRFCGSRNGAYLGLTKLMIESH